jgi:asparagine synthase (glutamine-hydrolysing)
MCGIAGLLGAKPERVQAMARLLRHRGPDYQDSYVDAEVGLAHARLSIIDLSAASNQPFVDPATGATMVYNGEIYNFRELRESLRRNGAHFHTTGDTEVILQGYLAEGLSFFAKLNGIFALGIWDPRTRNLVLARDPLGVKPLYYFESADEFAFASEAKSLYSLLPKFALHPEGLGAYLLYHYTPGEQTIVNGIRRLPPGEAWSIDEKTRGLTRTRIDALWYQDDGGGPCSPNQLWKTLQAAVDRQMVADVPVGAFLSGGIDSSIVAYLAAKRAGESLNTFSVGFDHGFDERPLAASFADHIGATHHELLVNGSDAVKEFGAMSWHYDGPIGEGGCIPNYFVSRLASKHVKVVLAGEGADELFGGYPWYPRHLQAERLARIIPKGPLVPAITRLFPGFLARAGDLLARPTALARYQAVMEIMHPRDVRAAGLPAPTLLHGKVPADPLEIDQQTLLRDCFLVKADKMTMAHGIEERVPFLDREVLRLSRRIPLADKLGPPAKRILRDAANPHLPRENIARKKRGYGTPMSAWAASAFSEGIAEALDNPQVVALGLVGQETWTRLRDSSREMAVTSPSGAWLLFALDGWVRELRRRRLVES